MAIHIDHPTLSFTFPERDPDSGGYFECFASLRYGLTPLLKVRAVMNAARRYSPVVRDFSTGHLVASNPKGYDNPEHAIDAAKVLAVSYLKSLILSDIVITRPSGTGGECVEALCRLRDGHTGVFRIRFLAHEQHPDAVGLISFRDNVTGDSLFAAPVCLTAEGAITEARRLAHAMITQGQYL